MTDDLARRIAAIETREGIGDLVIRYGMAVDDRDMATVRAPFTDDAVFRHGDDSGPAEIPEKLGRWQQFFAGAEA